MKNNLIILAAIPLMLMACSESPTNSNEVEVIDTEVTTCNLYGYDGKIVHVRKCSYAYLSGTNGWFDNDCTWHAGLELGCKLAEDVENE